MTLQRQYKFYALIQCDICNDAPSFGYTWVLKGVKGCLWIEIKTGSFFWTIDGAVNDAKEFAKENKIRLKDVKIMAEKSLEKEQCL